MSINIFIICILILYKMYNIENIVCVLKQPYADNKI